MKYKLKHYGIKAPGLNDIFKKIWKSDIKTQKLKTQIDLSKSLISSDYMECKYIGINILNKINKHLDKQFLKNDIPYLLSNYCNTWATWYVVNIRVFHAIYYPTY